MAIHTAGYNQGYEESQQISLKMDTNNNVSNKLVQEPSTDRKYPSNIDRNIWVDSPLVAMPMK